MYLTQILYSLRRREPSDVGTMWLKCIISSHLPLRIKLMLIVTMIGLKTEDYFLAMSLEITVQTMLNIFYSLAVIQTIPYPVSQVRSRQT